MKPIKPSHALSSATMMLLAVAAVAATLLGADATNASSATQPVTVVSYYFGNYHPGDPRNAKTKGATWSEWELVRNAKPRFPGHQQPHVPWWGYQDESDPAVMANKINAAADHGISAFIFDWYYYRRPTMRGSSSPSCGQTTTGRTSSLFTAVTSTGLFIRAA
jgi:hypothetical protein